MEKKKYIIELEDNMLAYTAIIIDGVPYIKPLQLLPYTEPDLERVKRDYDAYYERGYEEGLSDAWNAAKKIANMPYNEEEKVFGSGGWTFIDKHTAAEAIEKIRQYEQEKEEQKQLQVGDEVATDAGNRASVLYENPDGTQAFVFKSDGTAAWWTKSALHRTGRNFPEIATVLEKMRGEQDG